MDTSKDSAFDAVMALSKSSSSNKSTPSGSGAMSSSSQSTSRSREKKRKSLDDRRDVSVEEEDDSTETVNLAKKKKVVKAGQRREIKKAAAAAAAAQRKMDTMFKPRECMKHMKIEVHPSLLKQWYMQDLSREACRAGCQLSADDDMCDGDLLMWSRALPTTITSEGGLKSKERCDHALYIMPAEEIADLITRCWLSQHAAEIQEMADCQLIVIVYGVKDYFKDTGRKTKNSRRLMNEIQLELALVDMLVTTGIDSVLVDTPNDLALLIVQFTKAIAESPHKKAKRLIDEQAEFYMRGDNKKCVRVDANGNGLSGLWQQMVAILPNSSLEISRAVCAQYKSPLELFEAFQSPDGESSLAVLPVSRSAAANSRARKLGPEFARKMHTLMTARDGNVLID